MTPPVALALLGLACARPAAPPAPPVQPAQPAPPAQPVQPAQPAQPAWTRPEYFHLDTLHPEPEVARFRQDWYARTLAALGEPSFIELARRPGRAYRFLWLRYWHGPLSVRVMQVGDLAVAEARMLDGRARPEETGRLAGVRRVTLTGAQWQALEAHVQAAGLWRAATVDPHDDPGPEGARWVFEGIDDGRLHVVDRFSPDQAAVVDLGRFMLGLAGIEVPERELY